MNHHHHADAAYLERLRQFDRVLEPMHREMVDWLDIMPDSDVLDAGCGGAGMTKLLAEVVGEHGHVTELDIDADLLAAAQELLATMPYAITYQQGSLDDLPFEDGTFDLVWCSRVLHHMADEVATAREIRRVLKPGGRFALREDGFMTQLLPFDFGLGEPGLDTRIQAVMAWDFAQVRPSIEGSVRYPFGWTQLLRDAGFRNVTAHNFVFEALSPLDDDLGAFVVRHWHRPLEEPETRERLSADDQHVLEQLVDPDSPHYLLKRPDLHYVRVSTVYLGQQ